jgi:hydroxymethylbilane synthase
MAQRALKLGTRRSALARAQSAAVARALELRHAGLRVQLVGIDTRGDRITDQPLSSVEGKEFFTAEIDAALLRADIDFTVHSFKDLSLERSERLCLAAVPPRAVPNDVVVFARDVRERLAAGHELLIGSSSPRRASFVPDLLPQILPWPESAQAHGQGHAQVRSQAQGDAQARGDAAAPRVRLVELRGNVDSRLRRLHEVRSAPRHLDGVVLAFAGLGRLAADESSRELLGPLLEGLPRMVLPLSECPPAPAQGALALECRRDDAATAALLAALDDPPTRRAAQAERALLAERGGGCQQRFGASFTERGGLGALMYTREAIERDGTVTLQPAELRWTPAVPLPPLRPPLRPWDGSNVPAPAMVVRADAVAHALERLREARAIFITHRRALPADAEPAIAPGAHVWVPGVASWRALAHRGVWVEGCAEGLGFAALTPLLAEPWLGLPRTEDWLVLTHEEALVGWPTGSAVATYAHAMAAEAGAASAAGGERPAHEGGPPPDATHVWWASSAQFDRWAARLAPQTVQACGPGKTYEHIRRAGVHNLCQFPGVRQWREWVLR